MDKIIDYVFDNSIIIMCILTLIITILILKVPFDKEIKIIFLSLIILVASLIFLFLNF